MKDNFSEYGNLIVAGFIGGAGFGSNWGVIPAIVGAIIGITAAIINVQRDMRHSSSKGKS